jgi:hypothetical protein
VRAVLIDLFETLISDTAPVNRKIMSRILGKSVDWSTPVIHIPSNQHLQALARPGVLPIVWETEERKKAGLARSILDPIAVAGQEPLLDFLGKMYIHIVLISSLTLYIQVYTMLSWFML